MTTLEGAPAATAAEERYDVFVSYRRGGDDERAAVRLQRLLLSYRTPRPLVRAGVPARLRGVFRDEDELSAAPSLRAEIDRALRRSRALVVVCSPRLVEDPGWVRHEVERFREFGHGRIYYLLIGGSVEDALPGWLRGDADPLAADIRRNGRADLRRLKAERLKLLAPLLDCELADLTRLEDQRDRRNLLALTGLATSLATVFAALSVGLFFSQQNLAAANVSLEKANGDLRREQAISDASLETHWRTTAAVWGSQEPEWLARLLYPTIDDERMRLEALASQLQGFIDRDEAILRRKPADTNLREALRAFHAKKLAIAMQLKQMGPAQEEFERIKELRRGTAAEVLRRWSPRPEEPKQPWNNDAELRRLRDQLTMLRQGRDAFEPALNGGAPVEYAQYVSEYLPLLPTWSPAGLAEARRVLDEAAQFFEWKARGVPLTDEDRDLREAVSAARAALRESAR
jgi:hypothetical protein